MENYRIIKCRFCGYSVRTVIKRMSNEPGFGQWDKLIDHARQKHNNVFTQVEHYKKGDIRLPCV